VTIATIPGVQTAGPEMRKGQADDGTVERRKCAEVVYF
jgi:hypothetical protein